MGSLRTSILAVAALVCLAVAGCDDDAATPASTSATPSTSSATTVESAPSAPPADAVDCGEDFSSLDQVGPRSVARQCFFEANLAGKPAELVVSEVGSAGATTVLLRSNADRTIDVVPVDGGQPSTCAGLAPDERRVFILAGCD